MVAKGEEEVDQENDEESRGDSEDQDLDRHGVGKGWQRLWAQKTESARAAPADQGWDHALARGLTQVGIGGAAAERRGQNLADIGDELDPGSGRKSARQIGRAHV